MATLSKTSATACSTVPAASAVTRATSQLIFSNFFLFFFFKTNSNLIIDFLQVSGVEYTSVSGKRDVVGRRGPVRDAQLWAHRSSPQRIH